MPRRNSFELELVAPWNTSLLNRSCEGLTILKVMVTEDAGLELATELITGTALTLKKLCLPWEVFAAHRPNPLRLPHLEWLAYPGNETSADFGAFLGAPSGIVQLVISGRSPNILRFCPSVVSLKLESELDPL